MKGHCFCGQVQFEINGPITACVNYHCENCRRQCSAPMITYIGVADNDWKWLGEKPPVYNSWPGVERSFCAKCGTLMSFRSAKMSDTMHFYLAALEDPNCMAPTLNVSSEEKLS